jgi:predicted nucleic acid-binding protein
MILIYQMERNPRYFPLTDLIFIWLGDSQHRAVTSTISLTELLVPAYRAGDKRTIAKFQGLLTSYPNLAWKPPDVKIATEAARIRASYGFRTPDAIQAATAIREGAEGMVTNDAQLKRFSAELETIFLDDQI